MRSFLSASLLILISTLSYSQDRRIALVIGNSDYEQSGVLKNPVNDANLMAQTLEELDFTVIKKLNATKFDMESVIYDFSRKLSEYTVALFYYAGHGIQVEGTNYLLPIDAKLNDKVAAEFEAIDVSKIVSQFERYPDNINIVILDACRNNPFKSFSRGGESGFKAIPAPSGTIIAFATGEGATASDGTGGNGLYTSALAEEMQKPQRIEDVFINTRVKVRERSDNQQSPQEWSQLTGRFFFNPEGATAATNDYMNEAVIAKNDKPKTAPTLDRGIISSGGQRAKVHLSDLLEFGYSVDEVLESGVPSRYMHGINFQGGIIVDIDEENRTGLIAAPFDQARGAKVNFEEANEICEFLEIDGFDDWKLPSRGQLIKMYKNLKENDYGNFTLDSYWSGSTNGYNNAWGFSFSSGSKYDFDKTGKHYVRAVRVFTY
ncbi:caspase family protein [Fulvivirga lutea]|uniref:Caspase family protein n=1 Tax=Fulvivirga lutea TaxID=2810512 RepID=A0A974WI35_9BACT|nr:caspase family protein [Fulvivirga lutea]QSE97627.1 caspase family protein [Fulvivirga lutea]